jgi:hypothetical protein
LSLSVTQLSAVPSRRGSQSTGKRAAAFILEHGERLSDDRVQGVVIGDLALRGSVPASRSGSTAEAPAVPPVSIRADDGVRLAADVERSDAGASRGTIVFVHGFCGNRAENGLFRTLSRRAGEAGFDTVSYDWRGIGESDGHFPETTQSRRAVQVRSGGHRPR